MSCLILIFVHGTGTWKDITLPIGGTAALAILLLFIFLLIYTRYVLIGRTRTDCNADPFLGTMSDVGDETGSGTRLSFFDSQR